MRPATELRAQAERDSEAPRYITTTCFAESAGVPARQISRWLHTGAVWVPAPAVLLGITEQPGWEPAAIVDWKPGLMGYVRDTPTRYLNVPQMCERWHMTPRLLWTVIVEDGRIGMPDVWLGGQPGWEYP